MTDTLRELLQGLPRPVNRVLPDWQPAALTVAFGRLVHALQLSNLTADVLSQLWPSLLRYPSPEKAES
jgi:hypothetical protein